MFQRSVFIVAVVVFLAGCENGSNTGQDTGLDQEIAARDSAIAARDQAISERDQVIAERDQAIVARDQAITNLAQEITALLPHACKLIGTYDGYMEAFEVYEDQQALLVVMGAPKEFLGLSPIVQQDRSEVIDTVNSLEFLENALSLEDCVSERKDGSNTAERILVGMNIMGTMQGGWMNR